MIFVETDDNATIDFDSATRFSTDEHNNLEIWVGPQGDKLVQLFASGVWRSVGVDDED